MKTTQEWFDQLPEDYRDKALKNMIDPKAEHYTLAGAISNGFSWGETPEGKDYWNGVFREVMYGEKFEPNLTIEPIVLELKSEDSGEEKGGNAPDLLKKHKKQKEEIK